AVVEVGLGDDVACGVVLVGPGQALRVDDAGETQFGIVLERVAGAVGPGATDQEVEVGVLEAGDTTGRIRVGEHVALAVVGPRLRGSIGAYASGELPVGVPFQAGDAAHRVGDADRPAEGVPSRARAGAAGTGHLHGQPRRVAHHARHGSECVRDRGEATGVVVGVAGGGAGLVGDRRAVSPLVELMDHTGAVRPDDLHRQAEPAANGPQFASVGAGGGDDPAVLVVEERGGVSQRVGAGEQVAVGVVGEAGGVAERVGGGDHPAAVVDQVAGRVSGGGGEGGGAVAGVRVGFGVGQGDLDVAGFAAFCDDAVAVVVDVVVAAAVGVDPGGDAPAVVVDERGGRAGGFGDGGEVAVLVVAVGHQWQVGAVLAPAGQVQCGDQAVDGGQLQLMAGRVDQGRGQSVGGAVDGDGVAVAFGDAGQPGGSVPAGFGVGRGGEAADQAGVGVGERVVAVRVAGQQGAGGAGLGTGGGAGRGVRIGDQQPVGRDVDDADRVDLQALVD